MSNKRIVHIFLIAVTGFLWSNVGLAGGGWCFWQGQDEEEDAPLNIQQVRGDSESVRAGKVQNDTLTGTINALLESLEEQIESESCHLCIWMPFFGYDESDLKASYPFEQQTRPRTPLERVQFAQRKLQGLHTFITTRIKPHFGTYESSYEQCGTLQFLRKKLRSI